MNINPSLKIQLWSITYQENIEWLKLDLLILSKTWILELGNNTACEDEESHTVTRDNAGENQYTV